jgi:hypothetical protein
MNREEQIRYVLAAKKLFEKCFEKYRGSDMKEKIYMVKETGELLLWTNKLNYANKINHANLGFWFFQFCDYSYTPIDIDESLLEYIGEL